MLLIDCYLDTDSHGGIGVFSKYNIKKGTIVWEWNDIVDKEITIEEFSQYPKQLQKFFRKYGYSPDEKIIYYNADDSRFVNHSDTPNLYEIRLGVEIASRDIKAGEELTENYRIYDRSLNFCGSFLKHVEMAVESISD